MEQDEIRYGLISILLQADEPLNLPEILDQCSIPEDKLLTVLKNLVDSNLAVAGELLSSKPSPQYYWAARWKQEDQRRANKSKKELRAAVEISEQRLDIDSDSVLKFNNYVINEYKPPKDKRFLVFLQCSVRRPFSSSPSHGTMRKAITVATGYDPGPRRDFKDCPVHVVVLASKIGPVPYELEDVYPANVSGGGVKHFEKPYYQRVKPILAERMAQYIITHRDNYDKITTFTHDRYAEVMEEARKIAVAKGGNELFFSILPVQGGPGSVLAGKYWDRFWIQLYMEITSWLDPDKHSQADDRLRKMYPKIHQVLIRYNTQERSKL